MPYRKTIFAPNNYFHIFCRGNEKKDIFLDHADYQYLLLKMKKYKKIHNVTIVCYCLMPNHFHLLLRQNTEEPISSFMHRLTVSYSMYFNKRRKRVGHLFQGTFKAKDIMNDEYLLHLSRYIHLNPLEIAGSLSAIESYPWSSYSEYLNPREEGICEKDIILQQFSRRFPLQAYREFVNNMISERESKKIENLIIETK